MEDSVFNRMLQHLDKIIQDTQTAKEFLAPHLFKKISASTEQCRFGKDSIEKCNCECGLPCRSSRGAQCSRLTTTVDVPNHYFCNGMYTAPLVLGKDNTVWKVDIIPEMSRLDYVAKVWEEDMREKQSPGSVLDRYAIGQIVKTIVIDESTPYPSAEIINSNGSIMPDKEKQPIFTDRTYEKLQKEIDIMTDKALGITRKFEQEQKVLLVIEAKDAQHLGAKPEGAQVGYLALRLGMKPYPIHPLSQKPIKRGIYLSDCDGKYYDAIEILNRILDCFGTPQ